MNRQARLEGSENWTDFGDVTFFQAIKKLAVATSKPNDVTAYEVQTTIHAEVRDKVICERD